MASDTTDGEGIGRAIAAGMEIGAEVGKPIELLPELNTEVRPHLRKAFMLAPSDWRVHDVTAYAPKADIVRATFAADTVAGFIDYVNERKTGDSRVFAAERAHSFTAELDYHPVAAGQPGGVPSERAHKAVWACPTSPEWDTWKAQDGKGQSQADFAQFIEDNSVDIAHPPAAVMLEIARTMDATRKVTFKQATRLVDGTRTLIYTDEVQASANQELPIPDAFDIAIPAFLGGARVAMKARLRFRIDHGSLVIGYALWRADEVYRTAFEAMVARVAAETELPVFRGSVPTSAT